MARVAESIIDVILGEAGGRTWAERYADMLAIASVIQNRANAGQVPAIDVVSDQREFNAFGKSLPPGVERYRGAAELAWDRIQRTGPLHDATYYATPKAKGNLPNGLQEITRTDGHVYFTDPQGRSFRTAQGYVRPIQAQTLPSSGPIPQARPATPSVPSVNEPRGLARLVPNYGNINYSHPERGTWDRGLTPDAVESAKMMAAGLPGGLNIISAHRSREQNAATSGTRNSEHMRGNAIDIDLGGLSDTEKARAVELARMSGANRIGAYTGWDSIHVDYNKNYPPNSPWSPDVHPMFDKTIRNMESAPDWFKQGLAQTTAPTPEPRPEFAATSPDRPDNRDYRGPSLDPYQLNAAPVGPVERAPLGSTVVPPTIAPSGNTASPINAAPISPVQSGWPIADLTPSPPVDNQTLADAYRDMARGMDMMGVRGLDGRLGPQDPMEVGGKIEGDVNAPAEPVETAPRTEAPRTINDRQVAAVSPVPTRSVQSTTISPVPESRGGLLGNLGEIAKGRGASIAGSVLGGAVAGPVGSIVGGLLGNAIRGNGSGQGLFSGGLLSGNDYATPTTGNRSTGPMAAFNPFNYRYTGHSNPLWNEPRTQAMQMWQTPSANRSMNPGFMGTGLGPMSAVYSGTAPTGFTARSASNPNVSAMSLHGMVAHTNTQHGWTAMVDPHTGVQMGTVYGKAAVYSPVDDTWSFQPMDEARMAAKRGLPTSLGPVGKQAKGLRSTDPNPAVTGKAQSKGPAAQMGLMSRGLMGPAQSIGPGKGSTGFGGLGTGGLLGMVAQALFGGPTSSPGLAGMAAGPSAGTGMGIGGGAGMGMGSFGGGFGFGGGIGDPSDSRSTNRA